MSDELKPATDASGPQDSVKIILKPGDTVREGDILCLKAEPDLPGSTYEWKMRRGKKPLNDRFDNAKHLHPTIRTEKLPPGCYTIGLTRRLPDGRRASDSVDFVVQKALLGPGDEVRVKTTDERTTVTLDRAGVAPTVDQLLWSHIRSSAAAISFPRYKDFIDEVMCSDGAKPEEFSKEYKPDRKLPFPFVQAYELLKTASEMFLQSQCGIVKLNGRGFLPDEASRLGRSVGREDIIKFRDEYLERLVKDGGRSSKVLPYLNLIRKKLAEVPLKGPEDIPPNCYGILRSELTDPCLLELIWSYWHEEGLLVQTMNAISLRFQNKRSSPLPGRDPLAHLETDPLRLLNNVLWSYIQDEQHTLSVLRRAHEYDHEYGLRLYGRAVGNIKTVDSRPRFIEAFHNLLHVTWQFFKESDDTTIVPDAFPVLTALREVHLILAHGAHNQFGDLPSTSRLEMLVQMWLLARPEIREFLGGRLMVPYAEPWMDRVDVMKSLQGWGDATITHFHDLAVTGEQILLSIRWGNWSVVNDQLFAANWARYWRPELYQYIHAYRAVTGVDLTADMVSTEARANMYRLPSELIRQRMVPSPARKILAG